MGNMGKIRVLRSGSETQVSFEEEGIRGRTLAQIGVRSGDQILVPRRFFTREDVGLLFQVVQMALSVVILVNTVN